MRAWAWFVVWIFVGLVMMFVFLRVLTVGVYILLIGAGLALVVATRRGSTARLPGLLSGASLRMFYVAYVNRGRPGNICRSFADGGSECGEHWSPWPFLVLGVLTLTGGLSVFLRSSRAPAIVRD